MSVDVRGPALTSFLSLVFLILPLISLPSFPSSLHTHSLWLDDDSLPRRLPVYIACVLTGPDAQLSRYRDPSYSPRVSMLSRVPSPLARPPRSLISTYATKDERRGPHIF